MFQEATPESLLVEWHLDRFDESPLEVHRQADGEIQLKDTGDAYIDKWEQQIADGEEPDLTETFSKKELERLQFARKKSEDRLRTRGGGSFKATTELVENQERVENAATARRRAEPGTFADAFSTFGKKLVTDD